MSNCKKKKKKEERKKDYLKNTACCVNQHNSERLETLVCREKKEKILLTELKVTDLCLLLFYQMSSLLCAEPQKKQKLCIALVFITAAP